jgi:DNA topoisomerase I
MKPYMAMQAKQARQIRCSPMVASYIITNQLGGAKYKWKTLAHNGVMFPPAYEKHNIPIIYKGQSIVLDTEAEEIATLYAKYIETEYVKNKIFNKNFWIDWKKYLGNYHIESLEDVDFSLIYQHILKEKEMKKIDILQKNKAKELEEPYKYATVDGKKQPVGNFRMEPPGIFMGRGCNPNLGKIKRRIYPEDIIINIGQEEKIPESLPGHDWKRVIHDRTVEWLASWKDDITKKIKYVWLGAHSDMKASSDLNKYDTARKLKRKIKEIRTANEEILKNGSKIMRQTATALYFIDHFSLRVGNEKGDDETDTVGVTSLRKEHIQLLGNNKVKLDFLGKDSVRFNRTLEVDPLVYTNLQDFETNKANSDQLFDLIGSNDINKYLQSFMKKLTAKVFRTYNASNLFQKELKKISKKFDGYDESDKINLLLNEFNIANAKIALLCNHQKNINKNTNKQIEKIDEMIKKSKAKLAKVRRTKGKKNTDRINKMKQVIKKLKAKKQLKLELKNISLSTSKVNYIDPRIAVAFIKKHNIPTDKIFSKTLQEKFKWAMEVEPDYIF